MYSEIKTIMLTIIFNADIVTCINILHSYLIMYIKFNLCQTTNVIFSKHSYTFHCNKSYNNHAINNTFAPH